jgi:RNA polymerase sigma factor for flagellar operon FliA
VTDPRQWYVDQLDVINRIASSICRRNGVQGADAEDFASDVRLKLLQDDYAVLRKYRGASSQTTFLTVVISNLFRDHRIKHWGKWRPSAEAKRNGEVAVRLEAAMYRDDLSFDQACQFLAQDTRLRVDRAELKRLLATLPHRAPKRVENGAAVDDVASSDSADARVLGHERDARLQAAKSALGRAVSRLAPEDALIVRLHFFEGLSIADVARNVGIRQKPLYVRMKRLLETLHKYLASEGIGPDDCDWLNVAGP